MGYVVAALALLLLVASGLAAYERTRANGAEASVELVEQQRDMALAANRTVQKDVERLRAEVDRARAAWAQAAVDSRAAQEATKAALDKALQATAAAQEQRRAITKLLAAQPSADACDGACKRAYARLGVLIDESQRLH